MSEKTVASSQGLVRDLINWSQYRQTDWELPNVDLVSCEQCSPLSLVEIQRGSALIGRELQSLETFSRTMVLLCQQANAKTNLGFPLLPTRIVGLYARKGSFIGAIMP